MEEEEILGILESFNFCSMTSEKKQEFLESMFQITIADIEVSYPIGKLIELIQIRLA